VVILTTVLLCFLSPQVPVDFEVAHMFSGAGHCMGNPAINFFGSYEPEKWQKLRNVQNVPMLTSTLHFKEGHIQPLLKKGKKL
jgi:hypothetical protein